ncbi:MAG TPA: CRTAC1 family protein [Acidobacteriota bacterium]
MLKHSWRWFGILALIAAGRAGPQSVQDQRAPFLAPSTRSMAETLAAIARFSNPQTNLYLNRQRADALRAQLAAAPDPAPLGRLRGRLGYELLLAGETEAAIEQLGQIRDADLGWSEYDLRYAGVGFAAESALRRRHLLAAAYLRLGEQQNCIARHSSDSCLFPIQGGGVHQLERGSRQAIQEYTGLLEADPSDLAARWLLNLAYMTVGEYPDQVPPRWRIAPQTFASDYELPRFRNVAIGLGLDLLGLSGGVVVEDFGADGYLDLMVSSWGLRDQLRLFENNQDGSFTERTAAAGLIGEVGGLNLIHADYNNDGFADVLVLRGAWLMGDGEIPNSLLRNNGDGTFTDVTKEAGLLSYHPTQTAAWGDYNNDGWVDLFIGNETNASQVHPCELYENRGDGTFRERAAGAGVAAVGVVKGSAWGDYDNDGWIDLYVSRLGHPNLLFRNGGPLQYGDGSKGPVTFTEVSASAGVGEPVASFPTWFWDYDNDGWLDLFVASYAAGGIAGVASVYLGLPSRAVAPRLYRNNHDGTFTDVAAGGPLEKVLLVMGANFGDLDNDGFLDAYFGTGTPDLTMLMPNRMIRNDGGKGFQDVTTSGGFGHLQKGHGIAFADLDNDGDQDVYAVMGGAFSGDVAQNALFENPGHSNRWVTLRLRGTRANRAAIGARIKVTVSGADGRRDIYATVGSGGSFGASSLQQEIGLGQARAIERVEVRWPGGAAPQVFEGLALDRIYELREGEPRARPLELSRLDLSPGH